MSKVFKYYYDSVRPDLAENFAQKNNISAFRLSTSVKIVSLTHLNVSSVRCSICDVAKTVWLLAYIIPSIGFNGRNAKHFSEAITGR